MENEVRVVKTVVEEAKIYSVEVYEDLYAVRRDVTTTTKLSNDDKDFEVSGSEQLLVTSEGLRELQKGGFPDRRQAGDVMILNKNLRDAFRVLPWSTAMRQPGVNDIRDRCYDAFKSGEWSASDLAFIPKGSMVLIDTQGDVLPIAQRVEYIDGLQTHSGKWDLEILVDHLNSRDDIDFGERRNPDCTIEAIPYYNADENHDQYVQFVWQPSREDFKKVYEKAAELSPFYPQGSIQHAMFDLDILGLKEAGANLYEDYHGTEPVSRRFTR